MVFVIGICGLLITVILHAVTCSAIIELLKTQAPRLDLGRTLHRSGVLSFVACGLATKHCVDIVMWALALRWLNSGQFEGLEDAVYFSAVTYTSLGYGDIVLDTRWRLLCGFEAINGLLLFGISTALLFLIFQRLWLSESNSD